MMLELFGTFEGSIVAWDQLAFSMLFAVIFYRDISDHPENELRVLSNRIALVGCFALALHGLLQIATTAMMIGIFVSFAIALALHLAAGSFDRIGPNESPK